MCVSARKITTVVSVWLTF